MSYSTRRSGGFTNQPQQAQQNVGAVGQRRPVVTNNFVSGGAPSNQNQQAAKQPNQPQQQQPPRTPQQQNTNIQFRNQQTPQKPGQPAMQQQQAQRTPQQQNANVQFRNQQPAQQKPAAPQPQTPAQKPVVPQQQPAGFANPPNPGMKMEVQNGAAPPPPPPEGGEAMDTGVEAPRKRPFWPKGGSKISKKEKLRRFNVRLSKALQPKNAVMILNELVRNTTYVIDEMPVKADNRPAFKVTVVVDGVEHVGYGHTKIIAKNAAAENALKHVVKHNKLSELKQEEEGVEKMMITEDDANQPLPWQHVASFALFKLFTSWGEDPNAIKNAVIGAATGNLPSAPLGENNVLEMRPAKKMPANPETMNPLMLINQMMPHAQFEEIGKSGVPPHLTFTFKCTVNGQSFIGTGSNKKAAKKMAAFAVCHTVLGVAYPPDVYQPAA
nr:unnamed protein product [Callosobruchus analis]